MIRKCGNCGHSIAPPDTYRGRADLYSCPDIMRDLVPEGGYCEEWTAKIVEEDWE